MSEHPDVLFVVIDSARKDRVSLFDHDRETTPELERLATDATVYENAFVPAPWTLPSHCSMFTGRFPSEHGITNGFTDRSLQLSEEFRTLGELLSERGYATAGYSNNPWVGQLSGLDRGFDRFVEWDLEITRSEDADDHRTRDRLYSKLHTLIGRAAGQPHALLKRPFFTSNLVERAKRWTVETEDRPSFTFMNLMEAHSPYYPPKRAFRELDLDPPGAIESRSINARLLAHVVRNTDLDEGTRERVMEFYDASVRYQDEQLAGLLSVMRERDLYDDAMIVICADHGKTLGDLDRDATPPHYIRDVNVNVPLLIKWPSGQRADRVQTPVELADLYDVIGDAGDDPVLPTRRDGALVEDFVPHTGESATDVTTWRVLADPSRKYVRSDGDDEYLFEREPEESPIDAPSHELDPYRDRLIDRVSELETSEATGGEEDEADLGGTVEGQLKDLGYLS